MAVFTEPNTSHPTNLFTIQRKASYLGCVKIIIPSYELRLTNKRRRRIGDSSWRFDQIFFILFFFFFFRRSKEINRDSTIVLLILPRDRRFSDIEFTFLANISPLARGVTNNRFNRDSTCL